MEHIAVCAIYRSPVVIASMHDGAAKPPNNGIGQGRECSFQQANPLAPSLRGRGKKRAMELSSKQRDGGGVSDEADIVLADIDNLLTTTAARIERQRQYIRSVASDFETSMKAIADLDTMTSALEMLKHQRAQIIRGEQEKHWQAAALKFGWD